MTEIPSFLETPRKLGHRVLIEARSAMYARRAGVLGTDPPLRAIAALRALNRLGQLGSAITIAAAYIAGGMVPLSPYIIISDLTTALDWSVAVTLLALFLFGFFKGRLTGITDARGANAVAW